MKRLCTYLKSTSAVALVVMLVLSMMMGVFTLSASADETEFPVVKNEPTLLYKDPTKNLSNYSNQLSDHYYWGAHTGNYYSVYYWYGTYDTINLLMDDTNSSHKLNDILGISYRIYNEKTGSEYSNNAYSYCYLENFDTLLIKLQDKGPDYNTDLSLIKSVADVETITYEGSDTSRAPEIYESFFENIKDCVVELKIRYSDGAIQVIEAKTEMAQNTITVGRAHDTSAAIIVEFAHSTNINEQDFYNLNSIFYGESVNKNTTKKYYVDIEKKDNIILPMDNMSSRLTLEQTRIGDNIVFNTENSMDFGEDAVGYETNGISDGRSDETEKTYMWDYKKYLGYDYETGNSIYEDRRAFTFESYYYQDLLDSLRDQESKYALVELDEKLYSLGSVPIADAIDRGEFCIFENSVWDYYTKVPGVEGDLGMWPGGVPGGFEIRMNDSPTYSSMPGSVTDGEVIDFVNELIAFYESDTTSEAAKTIMESNSFCMAVWGWYRNTYNNGGGSWNLRFNFSGDDWRERFEHLIDDIVDGGRNVSHFDDRKHYYTSLTGLYYSLPRGYTTYEEIDAMREIATFMANTVGDDIRVSYSPIPSYEKIVDKIPVKDVLNLSTGEELKRVKVGGGQFVRPGKYAFNLQDDTNEIITDTFNNNEISFNYNDLKNIEKGVSYNVVNQVSIGSLGDSSNFDCAGSFPEVYDIRTVYSDGSDYHYWYYIDGNHGSEKHDAQGNLVESYYHSYGGSDGNVYHLNGEFITTGYTGFEYFRTEDNGTSWDYRTYDTVTETYKSRLRYTEYKWGELVFASRPDPVVGLTFNENGTNLTWSKPLDEGFGTEEVEEESDETEELVKVEKTRSDDIIYVTDYTAKIYDEDGNEIFSKNIERNKESDDVPLKIPNGLIENGKHYKAVVICTNILGDSDERECDIFIPMPKVQITMTPDQPVYRDIDTVVYTETVTNTGERTLTNVVVNQELAGEYVEQEGITSIMGTSAKIPDLAPGESYTFYYKVPASIANGGDTIINSADVTTAQNVTDDDECTVHVVYPAIKVTKTVDRHDYHIGDTVTWTDTVTNTGNYPLTNIVVRETLEGKFIFDNSEDFKETDDNAFVIPKLDVGESVTFKYSTTIDELDVNDDLYPCTVTATASEGISDNDSKDVPIITETDNDTDPDTGTDTNTDEEPPAPEPTSDSKSDSDSSSDSDSDSDSDTDSEEVPITDTESETVTDTSTEDTTTDDTATEEASTVDKTTEDTNTEDTTTEDTTTEDTTTEDTTTEDTTTEDTTTEDTTTEDTTTEDTTTEDTTTEDTTTEDTTTEDTTTEDTTTEDTTTEDTTTEDTSTADTSSVDTTTDTSTADTSSVDTTTDTSTVDTSTDTSTDDTATDTNTEPKTDTDTGKLMGAPIATGRRTSTTDTEKTSDTPTNSNPTPVTYTATPQPSGGGTAEPVTTGDNSNTSEYAVIMFAALAAVVFAFRRRKEIQS